MSAVRNSRWLVILTAVMWSTSGLFAKSPVLSQYNGAQLAFWRAIFAGCVLLPFAQRRTWSWSLIPVGLIFAGMNFTYLEAMATTTAANAIWLQSTSPMWVLLIGVFVLQEKSQGLDWVMLAFCLLGIGFILSFELQAALSGATNIPAGVIWAVLSGGLLAGVILSLRSLRHMDAVWLVAWNHLVTALVLSPTVVRTDNLPEVHHLLWFAAFGVIQMGVPYVIFANCVKHLPGHEGAFLILLEPILVPVWVWLAWRHHPSYVSPAWWTLAGGSFILCGLAIRYGWPWYRQFRSGSLAA
ncbi:MAG: EamA family transporter [Pirellulaceae bacterium]